MLSVHDVAMGMSQVAETGARRVCEGGRRSHLTYLFIALVYAAAPSSSAWSSSRLRAAYLPPTLARSPCRAHCDSIPGIVVPALCLSPHRPPYAAHDRRHVGPHVRPCRRCPICIMSFSRSKGCRLPSLHSDCAEIHVLRSRAQRFTGPISFSLSGPRKVSRTT